MTDKTGGPAFPALNFIVPQELEAQHVRRLGETQGMTLRDYAAIHAQFSPQDWARVEDAPLHEQDEVEAALRYGKADAMLEERERAK